MKILGVVFALVLFLLPLSVSLNAQAEPEMATYSETEEKVKNPIFMLRRMIIDKLEKVEDKSISIESLDVRTESSPLKARLEEFQKKFEDILKKLNNTDL